MKLLARGSRADGFGKLRRENVCIGTKHNLILGLKIKKRLPCGVVATPLDARHQHRAQLAVPAPHVIVAASPISF